MQLFGLTGSSSSGRQRVLRRLVDQHNFAQLGFGDAGRDMLAAALCLAREQLDQQLLHNWRETPLAGLTASPQRLLDSLGHWGRQQVGADLWVALLRRRFEFVRDDLPYEYAGVVIGDVCGENEARFVRAQGVLIHVLNPGDTAGSGGLSSHYRDQALYGDDDLCRQTDLLVRQCAAPALRENTPPVYRCIRETRERAGAKAAIKVVA